MIIWGSRAKQSTINRGMFYCPQCRNDSPYAHVKVSRYFTLYFIPLFPMETLGEAIRCGGCAGEFKTGVLTLGRERIEAAYQPWTCVRCGNKNAQSESKCLGCGADPSFEPPPLPPGGGNSGEDDDSRFRPKP